MDIQLRNCNLIFKSSLDSSEIIATLNNYGFRDKDWKIDKNNKKRIFFIGDSFIEGIMTKDNETIPENFLNCFERKDKKQYEIMNLGIAGTGFYTYMRLIVDAVPVFRPDYIIMILYSQDLYIDFIPHIYHPEGPPKPKNLTFYNIFKPRLLELFECILNKEQIFPIWNKYKNYNFYPVVPDSNNYWTKNESILKKCVTPDIAIEMKKGRFNPWAVNIPIIEEQTLKIPVDIFPELNFLNNYAIKFKCKLLVAYLPPREQITTSYNYFNKKLCSNCSDTLDLTKEQYQIHNKNVAYDCLNLNIPFLDLTPKIKNAEQKGNHLYFNYDSHLNKKGTTLVGMNLFEFWKKNK